MSRLDTIVIRAAGGIVTMTRRNFKPKFQGIAGQSPETTRPSCATHEGRRGRAGRAGDASGFISLMRLLQRLLGATLSGIAVSMQIGNVLICASMLLLGPAFILGLLPD
jgi:hypothetical protein